MCARLLPAAIMTAIAVTRTFAADPKPIVDDVIRPLLKNKPYLGIAVGVVTPDTRQTYFYGNVKLAGQERPPDAATIFALGSLTKAYTGVLLADLVSARKAKFDDPAQKYLPSEWVLPKRGDKPITLLDLATHYSGLPVQPDCLDFQGNPNASLTVAA